jgi:hypothetical protein
MKDRFDLEQEILRTTNYADDLRTISANMLNDYIEGVTDVDKYANAIEGIAILIEMQSNKMLDTMSQCFKLDTYKELV